MIYCVDTNVLINAWHRWYSPATHPTFWEGIGDLAERKLLGFPEQVYEELSEQQDDLFQWCRDRKHLLCRQATDETEEYYAELVNEYPGLAGELGINKSYADLYVVAVAAIEGAIVVTMERLDGATKPSKLKIPHVCRAKQIQCIQPYQLILREGWVFRHL